MRRDITSELQAWMNSWTAAPHDHHFSLMSGLCACGEPHPSYGTDGTVMAQPLAETPDGPANPSGQEASQKH